jgi:hypothetical protein
MHPEKLEQIILGIFSFFVILGFPQQKTAFSVYGHLHSPAT